MYSVEATGDEQLMRTVFHAMPLPALIVDRDMRITEFNKAAAALLGDEPERALRKRGGDALHCLNAEPKGCGKSHACRDCAMRGSVSTAISGGRTHRKFHRAEWWIEGEGTAIDLLVTATPLPGPGPQRVLLMLENISELLKLRGFLPVCAKCRKVRDDDEYWHEMEQYLHSQMHLKMTHGYCPNCFAEEKKAIEQAS